VKFGLGPNLLKLLSMFFCFSFLSYFFVFFFFCLFNRSMNLRHRGHEYTLRHISEPPSLGIPLSIDVYLAWSSSLCFIVCLFYTSQSLMTN